MQLISIAVFYALILGVGLWAARRGERGGDAADLILAGRSLPLWVSLITMTATWVGGGYINGTAEAVYDPTRGLLWAQAPWGYALSLVLGGLFFARTMRRLNFTTMLDPFERRYGSRVAALLFLPALVGEIFWTAAILTALGTTFGTILDLPFGLSIVISAAVVIGYTLLGGLRAVAYTDVIQLFLILLGLGLALPFALAHAGGLWDVLSNYSSRYGTKALPFPASSLSPEDRWLWWDFALLLVCGGIPWQVYFQRVLAARDERTAVGMSLAAALGCLVMAVPAVLIGAIGSAVYGVGSDVAGPDSPALILPWVLRNLTPIPIATIGLGAVAAAVMSSADSSILSASSMFVWNVYRARLRPHAGDGEMRLALRLCVLVVGVAATALALRVQSVYALWTLCADLVYVILFPQLVMALWFRGANVVGALTGIAVGGFLRAGGGEPALGLPAWLDYSDGFPLRTAAMLASLASIWLASLLTGAWQPSKPITRFE